MESLIPELESDLKKSGLMFTLDESQMESIADPQDRIVESINQAEAALKKELRPQFRDYYSYYIAGLKLALSFVLQAENRD